MSTSFSNSKNLRNCIENAKEPFLIRNVLNWDILNWSLLEWNEKLGNEELQTRCGKNLPTSEPQWERTTNITKCTFEKFLTIDDNEQWFYFDYKYLNENLFSCEELRKHIQWDAFGYPDLTYKESTIWIGTKGAHTPCHIDTYGCNLIAQIYGRKEWFLCPPEENLQPTRVPYEESSIYSKINFFSPNIKQIQNINNARHVILNPGEVLVLPYGWWHYVENLETAISINVWIPQPQDDEKRLEEAIARLLISQIAKDLPPEKRDKILNPNMQLEGVHQTSLTDSFEIIAKCLEKTKEKEKSSKKIRCEDEIKTNVKNESVVDWCLSSDFIAPVPQLLKNEILKWAEQKNSRFLNVPISNVKKLEDLEAKVVNALLQPEVLTLVKNRLL